MPDKRKVAEDAQTLRQKALTRLTESPMPLDEDLLEPDVSRYIHELRVHQVELEMQNEELTRTQKKLESSGRRLSMLFHKSPVGYLVLDDRGIIRDANATFQRLLGVEHEAIISKAFFNFLTETDQSSFLARYKAIYKKPEGKWMEHRILTAEGNLLPVRLETSSLAANGQSADDPGGDGLLLMTVIDLSEHEHLLEMQRLEKERRKAMRLLEQRSHDLGERVKELQCIYRISEAFQKDLTLPELLQESVLAIPPGWQYPDITFAHIYFDGWEFTTPGYQETPWTMAREIFVRGKSLGTITVGYLEERSMADDGPFLNEEWNLLHALAGHLGRTIERKLVEDELRQTTQMLDMFYSTSLDLLLILTPKGKVVRVNREWEQVLGYSSKELEGKDIIEYIHPDDLSFTIEARQKICEGDIIRNFINRYQTRQGDYRVIEWRSVAAEGLVFAVGRDITERKRIEEHLFRLSELQRLLMHSAISLINQPLDEVDTAIAALLRVTGRFAGADRVCLFKYDLENSLASMTHEWAARDQDRLLPTSQELSTALFSTWIIRHCNGEAVHIPRVADMPEEAAPLRQALRERGVQSLLNMPINHGDECLGFVCFQAMRKERTWTDLDVLLLRIASELLANVRLRRRNDLAMLRAYAELEVTAEARQIFLAKTSHELRTPLNGILGMSGLLRDTPLTEKQRQFVDNIHSGGRHLLTLINDILDLTKIEVGKMELEETTFDPRTVMEELIDLLAPTAQEKGLELVCLIAPDVPCSVNGDPGRLRQIVTNLLGNAIKFTRKGEVVVSVVQGSGGHGSAITEAVDDNVDTGTTNGRLSDVVRDAKCSPAALPPTMSHEPLNREPRDSESLNHEPSLHETVQLCFTIRDTGIGIPAERLDKLFSTFSQTDKTIAARFGGTGLGLAICRELVHLMHGTIGVSSEEGRGATFWFTVRLGRGDEVMQQPEPDFSGLKILVVDENAASRQWMLTTMQPWGITCLAAAQPDEALELLAGGKVDEAPLDMIFVNWKLEDLVALELARTIRAMPGQDEPRLVALLPLHRLREAEKLKQAGFASCLTKPPRRDRLRECLIEMLYSDDRHQPLKEQFENPFRYSQPALEAQNPPKPARILVAEDDPVSRQVMLGLLKRLGYVADAVSDGWEAIRALEYNPYDLVFMDCVMEGLDGIQATKKIRKVEAEKMRNSENGKEKGDARSSKFEPDSLSLATVNPEPGTANLTRRLPIIALTGHALPDDRKQFLDAGMDDHLAKPVFPEDVLKMLRKWLG